MIQVSLAFAALSPVSTVTAIATSGLRAADAALRSSAHNLANLQTEGFRRERAVTTAQADGGVSASTVRAQAPGPSMHEDLVAQLQARNAFLANLAVFQAGSRAAGSILDVYA